MLEIFGITFPIFAIVALGYVTVYKGVFEPGDMTVLGKFVMTIALPALMFSAVTGQGAGMVLDPSYIAGYALAGLFVIVFALIWFRLNLLRTPTGPARRAIAVMGTACPNSAYVGFPVLLLAVPDVAAQAFAMNILVESFLIVPICFLLVGSSRPSKGKPLLRVAIDALWSVVRKPMVIGLLAGLAVSASGLTLPDPFTKLVDTMASSTAALALFFIGGTLVSLPMRGNVVMAGEVVAGKLLVHPAMAMVAAMVLIPLGLPGLSDPLRIALILSAAMPMMGIYAIFAHDYGHEGLASLGLFGATVGAFVTVSAFLAILL